MISISLFAGLVVASTFVSPTPALPIVEIASQFSTQSFTVTDGDTIRLDDGTRVRLNGINAPESRDPQCDREAILGNRAKERLEELSATGVTKVYQVQCACKPGTEGTDKCNYGRSCGVLTIDGRDAGRILISEGLASFHLQHRPLPANSTAMVPVSASTSFP
ncbi:thermonuclease family protein [Ensifer aridi]|uniref:thermonuclease family protein n=1 Tax=Ensifer aridi TaxID=1708715 RepID=UPI001FCD3484|nr:thermonuclease family protein [Ensifer aridi]